LVFQEVYRPSSAGASERSGAGEGNADVDAPDGDNFYSPLTCDYCLSTFTSPAEWVRHIEGHAEARRPIRRRSTKKHLVSQSTTVMSPFPLTANWKANIVRMIHTL